MAPLWRLIGALLALSACADHAAPDLAGHSQPAIPPSDPSPGAVAATRVEPPASQPDIRGIVTASDSMSLLVEASPSDESGSPKAVARLTTATVVLFRNRERVAPDELTLGHNVSIWFVGPVQESYPVQATADTIVIEPVGGL